MLLWNISSPSSRNILMDRKIIGLKCSYGLLDFVNPEDTHRILGLKELKLGVFSTKAPVHILENFHLQHITSLVYTVNCTDSDLEIIGRNCKKLLDIDVQHSKSVTDVGLRALRGCPDLQYVCVFGCSVSESGIIELLSKNRRVRRMMLHDYYTNTLKWFSVPDLSVYPAIEEIDYAVELGSWPNESLRSLSDRFPNLKSLRLYGNSVTEDLHELQRLSRLSNLILEHQSALFFDYAKFLDKLFGFIGANIY